MAALKTAGGGTTNYPFFLRHTVVGDYSVWCIIMNNDTSNCLYSVPTESDCNTALSEVPDDGNTYTCNNITASNAVTESYVGFVVTPAMATANSGMTAGTYYLRGGDNGNAYNDNRQTLLNAFGSSNCSGDFSGLTGVKYSNLYNYKIVKLGTISSPNFYCEVSGFYAGAYSDGSVSAYDDAGSNCKVGIDGISNCRVVVGGGI